MLQGLGSFVIPVLSGYLFLTNLNFTRYGILKESGYHVLFRSAFIGILLFIVSSGITLILTNSGHIDLLEIVEILVPIDNAITLSLTFLLGLVLPIPLNLFYSAEQATNKVAERNGELTKLLIDESFGWYLPIEFSLRSGKSYIGYVIETQFTLKNQSDIALIPIASGYRDKDTKKLVITTNYSQFIEKVFLEDGLEAEKSGIYKFRLVIPMSEIVSARYFDREIYDLFQTVGYV